MQQLMQQAQAMQKKLQSNQEEMRKTNFIGEAGNGALKVTLNGVFDMVKVEIDQSLMDDKEMLEDLILVAYNDCKKKIDEKSENTLGSLAGNSNLLNGMF